MITLAYANSAGSDELTKYMELEEASDKEPEIRPYGGFACAFEGTLTSRPHFV